MRDVLTQLFSAAVEAVRGDVLLRAHSRMQADRWVYDGPGGPLEIPLPSGAGRILVAGAGKAAASLASGLEYVLGDRIAQGIVIVKHRHGLPLQRIAVLEASHPIPDATSVDATRALLRILDAASSADRVFFLLTGGASSLLCLPVDGLSLSDKASAVRLLIHSDAAINEINTVRKHLSAVKGGRLRRRTHARTFVTLAISDVVGDDVSTIGSSPTVADGTTFQDALSIVGRYGLAARMPVAVMRHLRDGAQRAPVADASHDPGADHYRIVASNRVALDACVEQAKKSGFDVTVLTDRMTGNTHAAARAFANTLSELARQPRVRPLVVLSGGETTLTVAGNGKGGRNQEFALTAALHLQGIGNVALLAAGTDGTDGPTDAAGAFADGTTVARAAAAGHDLQAHLQQNNAYPLLVSIGDLFKVGPTGTNVMDLVVGITW